jgi:hypothetical protein
MGDFSENLLKLKISTLIQAAIFLVTIGISIGELVSIIKASEKMDDKLDKVTEAITSLRIDDVKLQTRLDLIETETNK